MQISRSRVVPQPGLVFHGTALTFGRRGGQVDWIVVGFGCVTQDYRYRACAGWSVTKRHVWEDGAVFFIVSSGVGYWGDCRLGLNIATAATAEVREKKHSYTIAASCWCYCSKAMNRHLRSKSKLNIGSHRLGVVLGWLMVTMWLSLLLQNQWIYGFLLTNLVCLRHPIIWAIHKGN